MPIQVLALVTVNDDEPAALAKYLEATGPLLERAGGQIVQRFNVNQVVVGNRPAKSVIIVEYPSMEAVDMVFQSDEYKQIIPYRDKAFKDYHVSVVTV